MRRFEHGGNVYAHPGVLDFSASLNPLGMPPLARRVLVEGVDVFEHYTDPACRELTDAIARFEGVGKGEVLACAGATDAFARICSAVRPRRALTCAPCYSGYEQACVQAGVDLTWHELCCEDGYLLTERFAEHIEEGVNLVFVANPNNPTGLRAKEEVIRSCLERAREVGALVVLDECFVDLAGGHGSNALLGEFPNLVIVKALTKTYALAGLRVGYALCSDGGLLSALREATRHGRVVVNVSQCMQGHVEMARYDTGLQLQQAGVISGRDSTVEAAVTKLMYLQAKYDSHEQVRRMMNQSLCGEGTI